MRGDTAGPVLFAALCNEHESNHSNEAVTNPFDDEVFKARWRANQIRRNKLSEARREEDATVLSSTATHESSDRSSRDTLPGSSFEGSLPGASETAQLPDKVTNGKPSKPRSGLDPGVWKTMPRRGEIMARVREMVESPEGQREIQRLRELRRARIVKAAHEAGEGAMDDSERVRAWTVEASNHLPGPDVTNRFG